MCDLVLGLIHGYSGMDALESGSEKQAAPLRICVSDTGVEPDSARNSAAGVIVSSHDTMETDPQ